MDSYCATQFCSTCIKPHFCDFSCGFCDPTVRGARQRLGATVRGARSRLGATVQGARSRQSATMQRARQRLASAWTFRRSLSRPSQVPDV